MSSGRTALGSNSFLPMRVDREVDRDCRPILVLERACVPPKVEFEKSPSTVPKLVLDGLAVVTLLLVVTLLSPVYSWGLVPVTFSSRKLLKPPRIINLINLSRRKCLITQAKINRKIIIERFFLYYHQNIAEFILSHIFFIKLKLMQQYKQTIALNFFKQIYQSTKRDKFSIQLSLGLSTFENIEQMLNSLYIENCLIKLSFQISLINLKFYCLDIKNTQTIQKMKNLNLDFLQYKLNQQDIFILGMHQYLSAIVSCSFFNLFKLQQYLTIPFSLLSTMQTIYWFFSLIYWVFTQSSLLQMTPTNLQSSKLTLVTSQFTPQAQRLTEVTFSAQFQAAPLMMLSLVQVQAIEGAVKLMQRIKSLWETGFVHGFYLNNPGSSIVAVRVNYLALSRSKFPFFSSHQLDVNYGTLSYSEYTQVDYLSPLTSGTIYEIGVFLTGFRVQPSSGNTVLTQLSVQAELYTSSSYLVGIKCHGLQLKEIQITRYLIDETALAAQTGVGLGQLNIYEGSVQHYELYASEINPHEVVFYQGGFFVGITQMQAQSFNILGNQFSSIFSKPDLNPNVKIGFLVFMEKMCHQASPLYLPISQTCTSGCGVRTYFLLSGECAECHPSCYRCSGPADSQCLECIGDRQMSGGFCQCRAGLLENPANNEQCIRCSELVPGCTSCDPSTAACQSCQANCSLINSTTCSCGNGACGMNDDYECPHTGFCRCLPQFYSSASYQCLSCARGCYLCSGQADNCSQCVDTYHLVGSRCIFLFRTTVLIDSQSARLQPGERCLAKVGDQCFQKCPNSSKYYQNQCFPPTSLCPPATFTIALPQGGLTCHPCPYPCIECAVYYQCRKCDDERGYFKTATGACSKCEPGCATCVDQNTCSQCEEGLQSDGAGGCMENITQYQTVTVCAEGCADCLIPQFCQQCLPSYFLLASNRTCIACSSLPTIQLSPDPILSPTGTAAYMCQQICGDGIIINQMCDDGNTASGDGCSSTCQIEQGYACFYSSLNSSWGVGQRSSLCFRPDYLIDFRTQYTMGSNNVIELTLIGEGIAVANIPFTIKCRHKPQGKQLPYFVKAITTDGSPFQVTYKLEIGADFQEAQCKLIIEGFQQSGVREQEFIISSAPAALVRSAQSQNIIEFAKNLIKYCHKPLAYLVWGLCVLGLDPFDVWINTWFTVLFVTCFYHKEIYPPGVYTSFLDLRYLVFDLEGADTPEQYLHASQYLLALMGAVMVWNELFVRIFRIKLIFPVGTRQLFTYMFKNRVLLYIAVIISFQPIMIYYCIHISSLLPAPIPLMVFILNTLLLVLCVIFLVHQAQRMGELRSMRKFMFMFVNALWIGLFVSLNQYLAMLSLPTLAANLTGIGLLLGGLICVFDVYPQTIVDPVESSLRNSDQQSSASSFAAENNLNARAPANEDDVNPWEQRKGVIRKVNIILQISCSLAICVFSLIYYWDGEFSDSHSVYGALIVCILVFGNILFCTLLGIVSQVFTVMIYVTSKCPPEADSSDTIHPEPPSKASSSSSISDNS